MIRIMTYNQRAKDLFKMIEEGKLLEALDKYYDDNVTIIADDKTKRKGIKEVREYDATLLKEIEEVLTGKILHITSDEEHKITMVEFIIELKFKNGNRKKIEEVAVQNWENGKIVCENFYSKK